MNLLRLAAPLIVTLAIAPAKREPVVTAPPPDLEPAFVAILKLEDRRSAGGGELRGYLDASQPLAVRVRAALAAGRIGSPVTTPYDLIPALKDRAPELRRMAAFALGEMDDVKAAPLLAGELDDPDARVRALAAEALGKLKDPASAQALAAALDDRDLDVVGMALLALWKVDTGPALPALVARAAGIYTGGSGELRRRAAYFLMRSQMGHPEEASIETTLLFVARDADPLIRSFAARGLGALKTEAATEALVGLAADRDWRVRVNAFNGLKARPVPESGPSGPRWPVYRSGLADDDAGVALSALAALESFGDPDATERLAHYLMHPRTRFREVAALALAARAKDEALPMIRSLEDDPAWSVRARAAEALGSLGSEAAEEDLRRLAADGDPRVRSVAIETLGRRPGDRAGAAVAAALKDTDPFVRAAALGALAEPREEGRPSMDGAALTLALAQGYRGALEDAANDARLAALDGLAKVGGAEARREIEKALEQDPDYLVRRRAAEHLRDAFKLDRFAKVGEARPRLSDADYLEAVRRASRRVTATFKTDAGEIIIDLFPADAPLTVDNFIRLARDGKLDGLAFHRVVPNFVIQDGDPRGDGNGGPPWQIRCEINMRRYGEGAVGMALSGKDTGGSQYFITHSPQPHLDGGYTVFGQVVSGQDAVNRMVQGDAIRKVTIVETPAR